MLSSIACEGGSSSVDLANSSVAITAAAGDEITCTFTNQRTVFLRIHKYLDQDGNGRRNFEGGLEGFEFKLYDFTGDLVDMQVSNEYGKAHFNHLAPGDYKVCETSKSGWTNTQPGGDGCYTIAAGPKRIVVLRFGNSPADTVNTAAVQDAATGIELHADEYTDYDDENYFLTTPFVDADLNVPAIAGKLFLSIVTK
jgi:hypothetical protein